MRIHTSFTVWIGFVFPLATMQGGCTNVLGFGTATKFGLDIAQRADQTFDVSMGYDRAEIASIPAPENEEATESPTGKTDAYSVLATFKVTYGNPWAGKPLVLDQFFATGMAARKAAQTPALQGFFGKEAGDIAKKTSGGE